MSIGHNGNVIDFTRFRKPAEICDYDAKWEEIRTQEEINTFCDERLSELEDEARELGLTLRPPNLEDFERIEDSQRAISPYLVGALSTYELFRIINFGNPAILLNDEDKVLGSLLEAPFNTHEQTSYAMGLMIDPSIGGHNLGATLST